VSVPASRVTGENVGRSFVKLVPLKRDATAPEFIRWHKKLKSEIHDARVFMINLPTIRGLARWRL